ncbi:hypothetical protein L1987_57253 [Smallanthus sonchifolius]|uniref:Uncharacterized protein n=1 Tax=Smallanthus sonchifolius TaxID=185202 RepID=A0ACB9DCY9_9ASTR|nr:hypothetical protein L1987_57253 [Smallanthus sonchifolius]
MIAGKTINIDEKVNGFSMLHGKAIVGRMKNVEALKSILIFLNNICPGSDPGKVQYLGGLDLLISFEDPEFAAVVLEAAKNDSDKFLAACLWNGQPLSSERLAWVKVQGIPLHLFSHEVINNVGSSVWINEEMGDWFPEFYPVKANSENPAPNIDPVNLNAEPIVEEVPNVVVDDVEMPEVQPELVADVTDVNLKRNEILESNQCYHNEGNDCQSTPIIVQGLNKENVSDFVPAATFDFDKSINDDSVEEVITKISKRKKAKKHEVGRPSITYVSSNESLRLVKKPKQRKSDIFGLNGLLGINDSPSSASEDSDYEDDSLIDIKNNPYGPSDDVTNVTAITEPDLDDVGRLQAQEVEATKSLGSKLGVMLELTPTFNQRILLPHSPPSHIRPPQIYSPNQPIFPFLTFDASNLTTTGGWIFRFSPFALQHQQIPTNTSLNFQSQYRQLMSRSPIFFAIEAD